MTNNRVVEDPSTRTRKMLLLLLSLLCHLIAFLEITLVPISNRWFLLAWSFLSPLCAERFLPSVNEYIELK
jgi:hypothetical protein